MRRSVCLVVGLLMFGGRAAGAQVAGAPAGEAPPTAAELENAYARLEAAMRALPRDRFDPQGVIEIVGRDPQQLSAWVRDNTRPLPYRGALRASGGVLADRSGNSLDRSLLLGELVRAAGYSARLANATLPLDKAAALLDRQPQAPAGPGVDDGLAPEAKEARQRVARTAARLIEALGASPEAAAEPRAQARAQAEVDVADHWWVQWLTPGGQWADLDVSAAPGEAAPAASRVVTLSGSAGTIPLEAKDCHEVELRVIIEAFRNGKSETEAVLIHTFRPGETLLRPISFTHSVGNAIRDDDLRPDPAAQKRLKAALLKLETYVPVLRVGGRPITDASFTTSGTVDRNPKIDPSGLIGAAAAKTFGGFGGGLAGGGEAQAAPSGVLTAEWLEYEVRVPGRKPHVVRRDVFDLLGPAARAAGVKQQPELADAARLRRALLLLGETQVLIQPCDYSAGLAAFSLVDYDLRERQTLLDVARGQFKTRAATDSALSQLAVRDEVTSVFAAVRASMGPAGGTYVDRPNVVHHRIWVEEGADGTLGSRRGMDLAFTSTAAAGPRGTNGGADGFRARLEQGVADTLAEHLALGPTAGESENTIGQFDAMLRRGGAPVVARGPDPAPLARLGMPPDVLARATADLAAGYTLVVASGGEGRFAWWRIDAATGQTVGVTDRGYNSGMTERSKLEAEVSQLSTRLGHRFTAKEVEAASKDQLMKWAGSDKMAFRDLIEIQGELRILTQKLLIKMMSI